MLTKECDHSVLVLLYQHTTLVGYPQCNLENDDVTKMFLQALQRMLSIPELHAQPGSTTLSNELICTATLCWCI